MKSYQGKTVYITGGSSGIGLAAAKQFAGAGANVAIFSRDQTKLDAALPLIKTGLGHDPEPHAGFRSCPAPGQKFLAVQLDVGNHTDVDAKMTATVRDFGAPDILVNCAGAVWCNYFEDTPYEAYETEMRTNFFGVRNTVAALLPSMKERGGHIVNVSSTLGFIGAFGYAAYAPSKFAIVGFSEVIRGEFKRYGIKVSVLCPPDTDTPQLAEENLTKPCETRAINSNAGLMQPEQVAAAMMKGMERNRFMIVPGFMNHVSYVAKRWLPGLVFSMMDSDASKAQKRKGSGVQGSGGSGQNPRTPEP